MSEWHYRRLEGETQETLRPSLLSRLRRMSKKPIKVTPISPRRQKKPLPDAQDTLSKMDSVLYEYKLPFGKEDRHVGIRVCEGDVDERFTYKTGGRTFLRQDYILAALIAANQAMQKRVTSLEEKLCFSPRPVPRGSAHPWK